MFATWVEISKGAVAEGSKVADFVWIHFMFLVSCFWSPDSGFGIVDYAFWLLVVVFLCLGCFVVSLVLRSNRSS